MPFKLYLDGDGKPQFDDKGVPLFLQDGAADPTAIDVNSLHDQVRARGGEAATQRKEKDELAARLKAYDGLDPEAARKALETARLLDDGKLLEAGKVDEIRQKAVAEERQKAESLTRALEDEKAGREADIKEKDVMIHDLLVKSAFSESAFLREKTVLPPDIAYAAFGGHFTVEYADGKPSVVARDSQDNPIFSAANPGAHADREEALKFLFEHHPQRDSLLKPAAPNGGSGAAPGIGKHTPAAPKTSRELIAEGLRAGGLKNS